MSVSGVSALLFSVLSLVVLSGSSVTGVLESSPTTQHCMISGAGGRVLSTSQL